MFEFFRCVALAVLENGVKGLAEMLPGGSYACAVAEDSWKKYRDRKYAAEVRADIAELAQATVDQARAEAARAVREALSAMSAGAGGTSPEELIDLEQFLTAIPAVARQSLQRPGDPTGTTVPVDYSLDTPDAVLGLLPARPPRFHAGDPLPGKAGWVLDRLLGAGGFGEVWLARHPRIRSLSGAAKFYFGESAAKLFHEAGLIDRVLAAGRHPNIVPLLDARLDGDTPWLLYEYARGGNLTDWIHRLSGAPPEARVTQAVAALGRLADAVGFFHRLNPPVVHRDLKPSNVLFEHPSGAPRVTGFGIGGVSAMRALRHEGHDRHSRGGKLLTCLRGSYTPLYASPQQRGGADPDPRDDVHALGVVAYQMVTGHLERGAGPDFAADLREAGAGDDLIALLGRCVAHDPARRPRDAQELGALLAATHADDRVSAGGTPNFPEPLAVVAAGDEPRGRETAVPRVWNIAVPGKWSRRPAETEDATWADVCDTPSHVRIEAGEVYQLRVANNATDADFACAAGLAQMLPLRSLVVSDCYRLTDAGLAPVAQLRSLQSLDLSYCSQLSDGALAHLACLPNLHTLSLERCGLITDSGLKRLGRMSSLRSLDMSWSRLDAIFARKMRGVVAATSKFGDNPGKMPSVRSGSRITDAGLAELSNIVGLRKLKLVFCDRITDTGLSHLARVPNLDALDLSHCDQITDAGMRHLASLKELKTLNLSDCVCVTDSGVAHLKPLDYLQHLDLSYCGQITDHCLGNLAAMPALIGLNLRGCGRLTGETLGQLSSLPNLQSLDLTECEGLTDRGAIQVAKLASLRSLRLASCEGLTDAGMADMSHMPALEELNLSYCPALADSGVAAVSKIVTLRKLNLWRCSQITDVGLSHVAHLTALRELILAGCTKITDIGLARLSTLPSLEKLDLQGCTRVTGEGFGKFSGPSGLRGLNLRDCEKFTDTGVANLSMLTTLATLQLTNSKLVTGMTLGKLAPLGSLKSLSLEGSDHLTDTGCAGLAELKTVETLSLEKCNRLTGSGLNHLAPLTRLR